jgi:hypothetical protein
VVAGEGPESSANKFSVGLFSGKLWIRKVLLLILDRPLLFDNPRARLNFDLRGATTVRWGREIVADILTSPRAGCPRNRGSILGWRKS